MCLLLLRPQRKSAATLPQIAAYGATFPPTIAKPLLWQAPTIHTAPQRPQLRSTSHPPGWRPAVMQPVRLSKVATRLTWALVRPPLAAGGN